MVVGPCEVLRRCGARLLVLSTSLYPIHAASAIQMPGTADLFGVRDPLAVFPDSLPKTGWIGTQPSFAEYLHYQHSDVYHHLSCWSVDTAALLRFSGFWLGSSIACDGLTGTQRNAFTEDDFQEARRGEKRVAGVLMATLGRWQWAALLGNGPQAAIQLCGPLGPFSMVRARAWTHKSASRIDQRFDSTVFFFPMQYRNSALTVDLTTKAWLGQSLKLALLHGIVAGEKANSEQYNLVYLRTFALGVQSDSFNGFPFELSASITSTNANLAAAVDGTRYAELRGMRGRQLDLEIDWQVLPALRTSVGRRQSWISGETIGYVDVWPFTALDLFTATRFRLDKIDWDWRQWWTELRVEDPGPRKLNCWISGRFEWWSDGGKLDWKEREAVVPPLLFAYHHHQMTLGSSFTNALCLNLGTTLELADWCSIEIAASAALPLYDGWLDRGIEPARSRDAHARPATKVLCSFQRSW